MEEWKKSACDVWVKNVEDFSRWEWGDCERPAEYARVITDEIEQNAMCGITCERGYPEIGVGLFDYEMELRFTLSQIIDWWVDGEDYEGGSFLLAELEWAADEVRKALARKSHE